MNKPKIYLAGTISENEYRDYVKNMYGHLLDIKDPFVDVDHNKSNESIVLNDITLINKCDMLIAYINKITIGTTMEISHAYNIGKTVYIITTPELEKDIWLTYHSTKIYNDIDICMINALNNFGINYTHIEQNNDRKWKVVFKQGFLKEKGEKKMNKTEKKDGTFEGVKPLGMDDSNVGTRLIEKHYSPLVIRKYTIKGWGLFCGIICDLSLSDLDSVILEGVKELDSLLINDIQSIRNFCGALSEIVINHYNGIKEGSVESVGIVYFYDKACCSSLWGDMMHHRACRQELYSLLNIFPHV